MQSFNILIVIVSFKIARSEIYTEDNATLSFNFYKEKYHKKYNKREEKEAYKNFVNNLNMVTSLNMNPNEKDVIYTLNKYADVDPAEIQEHFAINISSYDIHDKYNGPIVRDSNVLRTLVEPEKEGVDLEELELYDLDDSKNLFQQYKKAFHKNYTKKFDRTVHYYKFVKALVNANREYYEGKKPKQLDGTADVIEHPFDYYY